MIAPKCLFLSVRKTIPLENPPVIQDGRKKKKNTSVQLYSIVILQDSWPNVNRSSSLSKGIRKLDFSVEYSDF